MDIKIDTGPALTLNARTQLAKLVEAINGAT